MQTHVMYFTGGYVPVPFWNDIPSVTKNRSYQSSHIKSPLAL